MNPLIKGCRFHHVAIKAIDFDETRKFYTQALGFAPALQWGEGDQRAMMLDIGNGGYIEVFSGGVPSQTHENQWMHLALLVEDPDDAYRRAIEGGASVINEPYSAVIQDKTDPTKIRIAFVGGPNREVIEFFSYQ